MNKKKSIKNKLLKRLSLFDINYKVKENEDNFILISPFSLGSSEFKIILEVLKNEKESLIFRTVDDNKLKFYKIR